MDYGLGSGILKLLLTRFVVGILSLTQLVYMSEIGILILRSSVPVNYIGFVVIFIQRGDYAADYCVDCAFVCVLNSGEWKKAARAAAFFVFRRGRDYTSFAP